MVTQSNHLPEQDSVTPNIRLGGVQMVSQGLRRHPLYWHCKKIYLILVKL